jgi:hypothetical protein
LSLVKSPPCSRTQHATRPLHHASPGSRRIMRRGYVVEKNANAQTRHCKFANAQTRHCWNAGMLVCYCTSREDICYDHIIVQPHLAHEAWDDAVEAAALVAKPGLLTHTQLPEVLCKVGRQVGSQAGMALDVAAALATAVWSCVLQAAVRLQPEGCLSCCCCCCCCQLRYVAGFYSLPCLPAALGTTHDHHRRSCCCCTSYNTWQPSTSCAPPPTHTHARLWSSAPRPPTGAAAGAAGAAVAGRKTRDCC